MKGILRLGLMLFCTLLACTKDKKIVVEPAVEVNGDYLTLNQMKSFFSQAAWDTLKITEKRAFLEDWINIKLLSSLAKKEGLEDNDEVRAKIEAAGMKAEANAYIAHKFSQIALADDELFAYYQSHKSMFENSKSEYKIQQITVSSRERLDSVLGILNSGSAFAEVAKEYSEDAYASNGGFRGFVNQADLAKNVLDKLKTLQKYVYAVENVDNKFLIFRYYDTREIKDEMTFEDVKSKIREELLKEKQKDLYQKIMEKAKKEADISIYI